MMKKKIFLDSNKKSQAIADRAAYFEKYSIVDNQGCFKKLAQGAPVIKNIDGSYYYIDLLPSICISGASYLDEFIREIKAPSELGDRYIFIWSK